MPSFNNRLAQAMKNARLETPQVARAVDKHPNTVRSWLSGRTEPDIEMIVRLASILDVTPQWLMTGRSGLSKKQREMLSILDDYEIDSPDVLKFVLKDWSRLKSRVETDTLIKRFSEVIQGLRSKEPDGSH